MTEVAMAIRILLALVFFTAGIGKARDLTALQGVVANYRLLPDLAVKPFAFCLPVAEILVAMALVMGISPIGELTAAAMLTLFAVAMAINIRRGQRRIDCGCFRSAFRQDLSWMLVVRNTVLTLLILLSTFVPPPPLKLHGLPEVLLTATVLFVLLQSLNTLWSVTPAWRGRGTISAGGDK
jgi:uncharacterized membrane protein YphA (DoxX/SURF4 family)